MTEGKNGAGLEMVMAGDETTQWKDTRRLRKQKEMMSRMREKEGVRGVTKV